jgi:hypothetical protein
VLGAGSWRSAPAWRFIDRAKASSDAAHQKREQRQDAWVNVDDGDVTP